MKLNKKYLLGAVPALALVGLVATNTVSAATTTPNTTPVEQGQAGGRGPGGPGGHGGFRGGFELGIGNSDKFVERLTQEASVLGISLDDMKNYWSQGKNLQDIATEKGISQTDLRTKLEAAAEARVSSELKALVDKGVITQAQADARATAIKAQKTKMQIEMQNRVQNKQNRGAAPATQPAQPTSSQS